MSDPKDPELAQTDDANEIEAPIAAPETQKKKSVLDDIDIDQIRLSYDEELREEKRKAGNRVALTVLIMLIVLIPLFASM